MRRLLIAGNWKMYKTSSEATSLVSTIKAGLHKEAGDLDVVVCPPFTALQAVSGILKSSSIDLGAQNMHFETEGAFTGEVSPLMLKDVRCRYVILGHSERRAYFKESNTLINKKVKAAVKFNLVPIVCVGEVLEDREAGRAKQVVEGQFRGTFEGLSAEAMSKIVIAYEPVWAIGTGKTATPEDAQDMQAFIRSLVSGAFGAEVAEGIRILYGGSVKPDNIAELAKQPDLDGALVGGASLKAEGFIQIVIQGLEAKKNSR
ncbi:MAG TPA: triose-phosphate isomerase [Candidatus Omnitrophota bacterium]|nr:triose-phosphate isomerase [Candidatus Omnitrophota bacterium]